MGQWVGPVVYDLERMAERARRLGYKAEVDYSSIGGESIFAGHHVLHIGLGKAAVVALEGGTDIAWVYSFLSEAVIAEIEGSTGTERLLRAVSVWGFGAELRARTAFRGHMIALASSARELRMLPWEERPRRTGHEARALQAMAASKGVPK